jgi:hypothetical protein
VERRQRGYDGGELAGDAAGDEGRGGGWRSIGYLPCVCMGKKGMGDFCKKNKLASKKGCGGVKF